LIIIQYPNSNFNLSVAVNFNPGRLVHLAHQRVACYTQTGKNDKSAKTLNKGPPSVKFHEIKIDNEVMRELKKHAEPFEDTPNTVLRRLLLDGDPERQGKERQSRGKKSENRQTERKAGKRKGKNRQRGEAIVAEESSRKQPAPDAPRSREESLDISKLNPLNFIKDAPKSLAQILEVIYPVRALGYARPQATIHVAQKRGIRPRTVVDKYCGKLQKKAEEIDELLAEGDLTGFRVLLKQRFNRHKDVVEEFFRRLRSAVSADSAGQPGGKAGKTGGQQGKQENGKNEKTGGKSKSRRRRSGRSSRNSGRIKRKSSGKSKQKS
jgi:hypothetical protein